MKLICQYEYGSPALLFPGTILMPMSALATMDDEQIRHCLRHECIHYRRGDQILNLLLSLLNAIYWFNPFIWLANRQIRRDMETACDSAAVKRMSASARHGYATLILGMFSQERHAQIVLSMAQESTRKMAERRIEGIYMKNKSKREARIIAVVLAVILLVCCFTTACQEGGPAESTDQAAATTALYTMVGAPKHWSLDTTALNGALNISADVDITLPKVSELPAATAVLSEFSQEDIENIIGVVLGKNLTFTETVTFTKESLEPIIEEIQQNLAKQEAGEVMSGVVYSEHDLDYYQRLYEDAPSESDLAVTDLAVETLSDAGNYLGVSVNTTVNGQAYAIRAGNTLSPDAVRVISISSGSCGAYFEGTYLDAPYGVTISMEEAAAQAKAIASQLTDELTLCYVAPTATTKKETERNWGWACVFMREINGCPTAYETTDVGTSMGNEIQNPVRYEKMVIVIDDKGVSSFTWENPMTITSIGNDNVAVLSYDEIASIALEQIASCWQYQIDGSVEDGGDPGATVVVTKVELGLMRVAKADGTGYDYIPVWNFFSEIEHTEAYIEKWGASRISLRRIASMRTEIPIRW